MSHKVPSEFEKKAFVDTLLFECLLYCGFELALVESCADEKLLALALRESDELPTIGGGYCHVRPNRSLGIAYFADDTGDNGTNLAVLFEKTLEKGAHT